MKDILVVEDGKQERDRLQRIFSDAGYAVVVCEDATSAEQSVQQDKFRLALLDIGLADKSGSHLSSNLKRSGRISHLVIFTGNPSPHLRQRLLDEGAADYVVKGSPGAQGEQLLRRVRELIGEPRGTQEDGLDLLEFLQRFVSPSSQSLFLDSDDQPPRCTKCGERLYVVTFRQKPQVPPEVQGVVVCAGCGVQMNPEVA